MGFSSLDDWKNSLSDALRAWSLNPKAKFDSLGANTLYFALAGTALYPVLTALAHGDASALNLLSGLASGIGISLLANSLQQWVDSSAVVHAEIDEKEFIRNLQSAATDSDNLISEIDAVLEKLEIVAKVSQESSASDREWFKDKIGLEIKKLGSNLKVVVENTGSGAVGVGESVNVGGQGAVVVGGDIHGDVYQYQVVIPPSPPYLPHDEALTRYLENLIASCQYLQLQRLDVGHLTSSIELEKVYVSLRVIDSGIDTDSNKPSSASRLTLNRVLGEHNWLVVTGAPGSGKSTLLAYLALTYAKSLRDKSDLLVERLGIDLAGLLLSSDPPLDMEAKSKSAKLQDPVYIPILVPLRELGRYLQKVKTSGAFIGPVILLNYLSEYYSSQNILLPNNFFSERLNIGEASVFLDGLDEIADVGLRGDISRLIESCVLRYPRCRFVVTCRELGYLGSVRLGFGFAWTRICDFSSEDVHQFVKDWFYLQDGSSGLEMNYDDQLIKYIESNPRLTYLSTNPLLLTVIVLIYQVNLDLPKHRVDLYEKAVDVLLAKWDTAKGMDESLQVQGNQLDTNERRSILEHLAFRMQANKGNEIKREDLHTILLPIFSNRIGRDRRKVDKAIGEFLEFIGERSGLFYKFSQNSYKFPHHTFQEYLAACDLIRRDASNNKILNRLKTAEFGRWREVVLMESGHLAENDSKRAVALINRIAVSKPFSKNEPSYNFVLAAECIFESDPTLLSKALLKKVRKHLWEEVDRLSVNRQSKEGLQPEIVNAVQALNLIESDDELYASRFWQTPFGEPKWVSIPQGGFWMGTDSIDSDEPKLLLDAYPMHECWVNDFYISPVPITNAQYALFVDDTKTFPPTSWLAGKPPIGKANHPVVNVTWFQALEYCYWLGTKIGKTVRFPTEAEWEKAGRGLKKDRIYPWGSKWSLFKSNSQELNIHDTLFVGAFVKGVSPYHVLDISGNVLEWTYSLLESYPYIKRKFSDVDGSDVQRVLRGGSFESGSTSSSCVFRLGYSPNNSDKAIGFRVVMTK